MNQAPTAAEASPPPTPAFSPDSALVWASLLQDHPDPVFPVDKGELSHLIHSYLTFRVKVIRADTVARTMSVRLNAVFQEHQKLHEYAAQLKADLDDARAALPADWEPARIRNERDAKMAEALAGETYRDEPLAAGYTIGTDNPASGPSAATEAMRTLASDLEQRSLREAAAALDPSLVGNVGVCASNDLQADDLATAPQAVANGGDVYPVVGDLPAELSPQDGA